MIKRMYPSADYKNKIGLNQPTETNTDMFTLTRLLYVVVKDET